MIFINKFVFPPPDKVQGIILTEQRTCINNPYPIPFLVNKKIGEINFAPITVFYGGNGSGKTTILNIIARRIGSVKKNDYKIAEYFDECAGMCDYTMREKPMEIKSITSDDIFNFLNDIHGINRHIDRTRDELWAEWSSKRNSSVPRNINWLDNLSLLKSINDSKRLSGSEFIRRRLSANVIEKSNGESALLYFETEIKENSVYILDEPENCLSAVSQIKLAKFIEESARFFNCQFIIATHSPFLLAIKDNIIYNVEPEKIRTDKWTELENIKTYYEFFKDKENEFFRKN
jgi:predicted ATPase